MRAMPLLLLPVLLTLVAVPAPTSAQSRVDATGDYLQRMDIDRDGRVSLDEYLQWMGYAFEHMDLDRDGVLSPAELPGGRGRPVTRAQHQAALAAGFHRQDLNGDGFLDVRELAAPPSR
jgi:Ca2+-binding EF-hand superfamily protein